MPINEREQALDDLPRVEGIGRRFVGPVPGAVPILYGNQPVFIAKRQCVLAPVEERWYEISGHLRIRARAVVGSARNALAVSGKAVDPRDRSVDLFNRALRAAEASGAMRGQASFR